MSEYLTVDEAASLLRIRPEAVIEWIKSDRLVATKPAKRWLIAKSDLQELLQNSRNRQEEAK